MNYLKILVALSLASLVFAGLAGCKGEDAASGPAPATGASGHSGSGEGQTPEGGQAKATL
jgi:hypothetical protein